jgi:hypothetical protein
LLVSILIGTFGIASLVGPSTANAVGPTLPPGGAPAAPVTTKAAPVGPPAPAGTPKTVPRRAAKKVASKKTPNKKASTKKTSKSSKASGLGQGARGEKVKALQERLIGLKYDITEAEGQFGDQTYHAVLAFQKANGLNRTGSANSQTLAALETATAPAPMMPNGGSSRVEVDLKRQILLLWENGELYRIISISSGSGKDFCSLDPETDKTECDVAITPTGSFRVTRRWVGWRESKLGEMYNPLYFTGGFAIHGSLSVPGYPASHGCIRVPMVSAEWLPGIIEDTTPVYVFGAKDTDKKPTPLKFIGTPPTTTGPTIPGATTPGATTTGTTATTTTSTTVPPTTLVRLLGGSTVPGSVTTAATTPVQTAVPTTVPTTTIVTTSSTTGPTSSLLPIGQAP